MFIPKVHVFSFSEPKFASAEAAAHHTLKDFPVFIDLPGYPTRNSYQGIVEFFVWSWSEDRIVPLAPHLASLWDDDTYSLRHELHGGTHDLPPELWQALWEIAQTRPEVRLNIAKHVHAPRDFLAILASDTDPKVVAEVAKNLRTPVDTLRLLARSEITGEKAPWYNHESIDIPGLVAANPRTPPDLLLDLVTPDPQDPKKPLFFREVASNTGTWPSTLDWLASLPDEQRPTNELAKNKSTLVETLHLLVAKERWDSSLDKIATNPNADKSVLLAIMEHPQAGKHTLRNVAIHPKTDAEMLEKLSVHKAWEVRKAVAKSPKTPPLVLAVLARKDGSAEVKTAARSNKNYDPDLELPQKPRKKKGAVVEESFFARLAKAKNTSTPPETLRVMATDADAGVRAAVAMNEATPPDALIHLAADQEASVRQGVADNKKTPVAVLVTLAKDSDGVVRSNVAYNEQTLPKALAQLAADLDPDVLKNVARNPHTPARDLAKLARDPHVFVRQNVAMNANTPAAALDQLATDDELRVRAQVAGNKKTAVSTLAKMAEDTEVEWQLASNPNTPVDILARLAENTSDYLRRTVASNESTPAIVLAKLKNDADKHVRNSAHGNPNFDPNLKPPRKKKPLHGHATCGDPGDKRPQTGCALGEFGGGWAVGLPRRRRCGHQR